MKINISDMCTGHGVCESVRPDIFEVNEEGFAEVINDELTEDDRADIEYAVANCPTQAISLIEDPASGS